VNETNPRPMVTMFRDLIDTILKVHVVLNLHGSVKDVTVNVPAEAHGMEKICIEYDWPRVMQTVDISFKKGIHENKLVS